MKKILIIMTLILSLCASVTAQKISSVYTNLSSGKCKIIESNPDEGGSYIGECAGIGDYKLELVEGDIRQTINIIQPNKKDKRELEFWSFKGGFSSVGDKAEWRIVKKGKATKPIALIIRYNVSENAEDSSKITSYLMVAKINGENSCITDIVSPSKNQNVEARKLADKSAEKPCLERE